MARGSIIKRKLKAGNSYRPKFDTYDAAGQRLQGYGKAHRRREDAERELREILSNIDRGEHVRVQKQTLADWVGQWLDGLAVLEKVSLRTHEGYSLILQTHVLPTLGNVPLQKLNAQHLDGLYRELLRSGSRSSKAKKSKGPVGLAPRTVLHVHRALFTCLEAAERKNLIGNNPAKRADVPRVKRTRQRQDGEGSDIRAMDPAEAGRLLEVLKGGPLYVLAAVALGTGLRRGELLALKWSAIDLERKTLRVDRVVEVTRAKGVRIKSDAKTESSRRTIAIRDQLVDLLRAHRREQREMALRVGAPYPADGLVFPCVFKRVPGRPSANTDRRDIDFTRPYDPEYVTKEFRRVAKRAGLDDVRLHDLRHTAATHMLLDGVPVHAVAHRLGHSTPVITMTTYAHVLKRGEDQAAEASDGLLRAALGRGG